MIRIKLNNKSYNVNVDDLQRSFEVADNDSSGRLQNWKMHRDVAGTFYNYTLKVSQKDFDVKAYDDFYNAISSPVESQVLEVPYGQGVLVFDAYISKGKDSLKNSNGYLNIWDGLTINFIAMEPQRRS